MSNLIHNEMIKLEAAFWNNLAVAAFAAGGIIPTVTLGFMKEPVYLNWPISLAGLIAGVSIGMHCRWHRNSVLNELKE